jgi:regulator of sigma E protease
VSWVLALAGFSMLIILHELGHFAVAKAVGMRVERFSLFFPPHVLKRKVGDTEYALGVIPVGGYVKISGMSPAEDLPDDVRTRAYHAQPVWKRMVVIAAGPAVNLILAFLLMVLFFTAFGPRDVGVATVQKGYPAVGVLRPGDVIVSVDGQRGNEKRMSQLIAAHRCARQPPVARCLAAHPARVVLRRHGRALAVTLTPIYDATPKVKRMRLGFQYGDTGPRHAYGFGTSISKSASAFGRITGKVVQLPVYLFNAAQRKQLTGPVGTYEYTRQAFLRDAGDAVLILAILSLSLAIINLFPFLPLDGGHIFWAVVEKVRRRPVPFSVMERAGVVGFALILCLYVIGFSNDISRLTGKGFGVR